MTELEEIVKGLGLGGNISNGRDIGSATMAMNETLPRGGAEGGVELTDVRRDTVGDETRSGAGRHDQEGRSATSTCRSSTRTV